MTDEWERLKNRIAGLSNEELLKMIGPDKKDYRQEALQFATAELDRRGVHYRSPMEPSTLYTAPQPFEDENEDDDSQSGTEPAPAPICKQCGAEARLAYLFTDREITLVFSDNSEERFLEVHACAKCGHVRLEVDYETDVEAGGQV